MIHTLIGDIGHLCVIISFIASIVALIGFFKSSQTTDLSSSTSWLNFSRLYFSIHCFAVWGVITSMFIIIYNHYYEYHYAWEHSSNNLPSHYMISCFWEGQEGSFLLWTFWHTIIGLVLMRTSKTWEAPVMTILSMVQVFLSSMILGVVFFDLKLGSSPFILLRDFMTNAPIFKMNPNFVPVDGTGLNPLLQNYWMVIHPPTLFLGFALCVVPFAYCIAGLWKSKPQEWIRPALPWTVLTALILGIGILMGGYWAYETLNFGGYWNWDPVENAVYVPWLIVVASLHTMIMYKKKTAAIKSSVIFVILAFLLILYSTFLTRSGVLGNASVHSFTDLGLSGQLLIYLLAFVFLSLFLIIKRWKLIPSDTQETTVYNKEFWIYIGIMILSLSALQIIVPTSIPVFNKFMGVFNIKSNIAPPANQIQFYGDWQIWFSIFICIFCGTAQLFYWQKVDSKRVKDILYNPLIITGITIIALILLLSNVDLIKLQITSGSTNELKHVYTFITYILLLCSAVFCIVTNIMAFMRITKNNFSLIGGAVTHIGLGVMLIGILYSAGYNKIISLNTSGLVYAKEFDTEMNRDNVLLFRHSPIKMSGYTLTYRGPRIEVEGVDKYVNKEELIPTSDSYKMLATRPIKEDGKVLFKDGDTVKVSPENTYYEIEYSINNVYQFTLYPRAQINPQMGLLASPDIKHFFKSDLYTHISSVPDSKKEVKWSEIEEKEVAIGDTFFLNDYVAKLVKVDQVKSLNEHGIQLGPEDVAVKAEIKIFDKDRSYTVLPTFIIKDKMVGRIPEKINDLAMKVILLYIDPVTKKFTIGHSHAQKDWVILKATEKPLINLLWTGALLICVGMCMSLVRRVKESQKGEKMF